MAGHQGIPVLPENEAVIARAKIRDALKKEYLKQSTHPFRYGPGANYVFDPAFQRFSSMKASYVEYFKVSKKTNFFGIFGMLIPYLAFTYHTYVTREAKENDLRTGKVGYRDRLNRFF